MTLKYFILVMALIAAGLLGTALIGQYVFDLHPCDLCIYQRYPYAAIILIGMIALVAPKSWHAVMAWICISLFAIDGGIATYHAGVELGWFPGLSGCSNDMSGNQTLEEMRRAIMNAPLVTCDQAMIKVLGLSMAAWNAIAAFCMTFISIFFIKKN